MAGTRIPSCRIYLYSAHPNAIGHVPLAQALARFIPGNLWAASPAVRYPAVAVVYQNNIDLKHNANYNIYQVDRLIHPVRA